MLLLENMFLTQFNFCDLHFKAITQICFCFSVFTQKFEYWHLSNTFTYNFFHRFPGLMTQYYNFNYCRERLHNFFTVINIVTYCYCHSLTISIKS